jgi:hypothetical protein
VSRTRLIRPAFFKHAELFDAEQASGLPLRLAFAGLWTVADKEGRFSWKPRDIKADAMPHDALDFAAVLDALHQHGFVTRYRVEGKDYGCIPSWAKHQSPHKTERPSELPSPLANGAITVSPPFNAVAVAGTDTGTVPTDRTTPVGPSWKPIAEQNLAERLTSSAGRNALSAVLQVAGSKAGVVAELEALLGGDRGAQHRCSPEQLDVALSDYVTNGMSNNRWNAQHFRACVRRAMRPAEEHAPPTKQERIVAALHGMKQ